MSTNPLFCSSCGGERIIEFSAELTEGCQIVIQDREHNGDLPDDINLGDNDMLCLIYCGDCGQIQNDWPLDETVLESDEDSED